MTLLSISQKKKELESHLPLPTALQENLENWFKVELTYTSNAIEGNTLSRRETAVVIEEGLTIGNKTLQEHLEATNHAQAFDWVLNRVKKQKNPISNRDILTIHGVILDKIDTENASRYRNIAVRISGSQVILPNPRKVSDLMQKFESWLHENHKEHPVWLASEAHYQLASIHPFIDGNGRTARLLMNLLLLLHGYPPAIIRKQDRLLYLSALEKAQLGGSKDEYEKLIFKSIERSLDIYLKACQGDSNMQGLDSEKLLKIGDLAKACKEQVSTVRYWTQQGLLEVAEHTHSGYQLYAPEMLERCEKIQELKAKRLTLAEIEAKLNDKYK